MRVSPSLSPRVSRAALLLNSLPRYLLIASIFCMFIVSLVFFRQSLWTSHVKEWVSIASYPEVETNRFARIAYGITVAAENEVESLDRLLKFSYDPRNLYLVHLDAKASAETRNDVQAILDKYDQNSADEDNTREQKSNLILISNPLSVAWGGFSLLLANIYCMVSAIQYENEWPWDYWINISPSDLPLMPQEEIMELLAEFGRGRLSFVAGQRMNWDETHEIFDRRKVFHDDSQIYQIPTGPVKKNQYGDYPGPELLGDGSIERTVPNAFEVFKSDLWVILYREMVEYIVYSFDNTARLLIGYLTSAMIPDELFFGTLACHPTRKTDLPIVSNSAIRFAHWDGHAHPAIMDLNLVKTATDMGSLFARKFEMPRQDDEPIESIEYLHSFYNDTMQVESRMSRARSNLVLKWPDTPERPRFCL